MSAAALSGLPFLNSYKDNCTKYVHVKHEPLSIIVLSRLQLDLMQRYSPGGKQAQPYPPPPENCPAVVLTLIRDEGFLEAVEGAFQGSKPHLVHMITHLLKLPPKTLKLIAEAVELAVQTVELAIHVREPVVEIFDPPLNPVTGGCGVGSSSGRVGSVGGTSGLCGIVAATISSSTASSSTGVVPATASSSSTGVVPSTSSSSTIVVPATASSSTTEIKMCYTMLKVN